MRSLHLIILSFTCCILFVLIAETKAQNSAIGFHFTSKYKKKFRLSFQQYNNLIIIPVKINDLPDTLNFILDTGVGATVIADTNLAKKLQINPYKTLEVSGGGEGESIKAHLSNNNTITIAEKITADKYTFIVLKEDVLQLSSYAGIKIHGIIGYDLFSRFVVKVNYVRRELTLYEPEKFSYKGKGKIYDLTIENQKPYIQALAISEEETNFPVKLLVDTGAGHSLSLEQGSNKNLKIPQKNIRSHLGMTLSGSIQGCVGRMKKFILGDFVLDSIITSFPDSNAILYAFFKLEGRQGNLGYGVLNRFETIFDYPHGHLILKPNKNFKEPFEYTLSGINLIARAPHFKTYEVVKILPNSPAWEAGLREGDVMLSINDKMANELKISDIYDTLNKKEGKKVRLFVQRGGELFFTNMTLRRFL